MSPAFETPRVDVTSMMSDRPVVPEMATELQRAKADPPCTF